MSKERTLLVTGAAGHLGRRVVERLLERGAPAIIATTRDPSKLADLAARGVEVRAADFDAPASLASAFRGASRALLVSTDAFDRPGRRLEQHQSAIAAFREAGVDHVVYTSLVNTVTSRAAVADDHAKTEAAIVRAGVGGSILRNSLYTDLFLQSLPGAIASGALVDARGDARAAFVTREDCALAAAGALLDGYEGFRTLDVTGPSALTSAEVAAIVSEIVGKPILHVPVSIDQLVAGMVSHGLPRPVAELFASFDAEIAAGGLAGVTNAVESLAGRAPIGVAEFLRENRAAFS